MESPAEASRTCAAARFQVCTHTHTHKDRAAQDPPSPHDTCNLTDNLLQRKVSHSWTGFLTGQFPR